MPRPSVTLNIQDPGLGIVQPSAGRVQVKVGVSQKALPNVLLGAGTVGAAEEAVGRCPMLDAAAQVFDQGGGELYFMPVEITADGAVTGLFTLTGAGTGTVTGSRAPSQTVKVKILAGGTPGAGMTYQTLVGAGGYGPTITSSADPYSARVAGQRFSRIAFGNVTYVAGDIYTVGADGTVTRTGTGPTTALDSSVHSPVDAFDIAVQITTDGGLGTGAFRYSLDGGESWSGDIGIPSGAGRYVLPGAGVAVTFAGTFLKNDIYRGASTPPGFSTGDSTTALTALRADSRRWGFLHVVGTPANAADALTLAAAVGAQLTAYEAQGRYAYGLTECPAGEGDATLLSTFSNFVHERMGVGAGDIGILSTLSGRLHRRNIVWAYAAKRSAQKLSTHPGQIAASDGGGPLKNVVKLYRDEFATPGLDQGRFITATTQTEASGFYITRGRMMAAPGSDYENVMNRAVMDELCRLALQGFTQFLNMDHRIDRVTGFIDERDAQEIEAIVQSKCESLVEDDEVSAVEVTLSRTDNILSTKTLNAEVGGIPKGYSEFIKVKIGLVNPAQRRSAA